jgi:hypothetical protein
LKTRIILLVLALFLLGTGYYTQIANKGAWAGSDDEHPQGITGLWPPQKGQPYPDIELIDQEGKNFKLSDYKGHVILVEPVGMTCPGCQGLSGAGKMGAFGGGSGYGGDSLKELFPRYTEGLSLPGPDIIFVQILLYDMKMGPPQPKDAAEWAAHFKFNRADNEIVAVIPYDVRGKASYNLIPGLQLIDRQFILRSDATGDYPKENMYTSTLPLVPKVIQEGT